MVKWLHKILFLTITFSFFISATEIDLCESHNTFFDEYDTYVKTEHVSLEQTSAAQPENDTYILLHNFFTSSNELKGKSEGVKHHSITSYNQYPSKLFLRNSVWRI